MNNYKNQLNTILKGIKDLLSIVVDGPKGIIRQEILSDKIYSLIKRYTNLNRLLDNTKNIWLGSDWHLWNIGTYENDFKAQLIANQKRLVKPSDVFIYLGDFAHRKSEYPNLPIKIAKVIQAMPGKKVMVLGNHDIFDSKFYLDNGFDFVNDGFIWQDMVFTHKPVDVKRFDNIKYNIHGHTHDWDYNYKDDPTHIVVYSRYFKNEPIKLDELLAKRETLHNLK